MVHRIYPAEHQLYKASESDIETVFLSLNSSIHNNTVSTKNRMSKMILTFPFRLDGDVPRRPSYGVYTCLNLFALPEPVSDINSRNKFLTAKLLKQGHRYHKHRKAFPKFYRRNFELIEKYHVSLKVFPQSIILWRVGLNHLKSKFH